MVVAAVIGLVVGAAGVGLPWLFSADNGSTGSTMPISAPTTLGSLRTLQSASAQHGSQYMPAAQQAASDDAQSAKQVSTAYGGAAALVAHYTDSQLDTGVLLIAVRADSPQPFVMYQDPRETGGVTPPSQVRDFGAVACEINSPPSGSQEVSYCQRSGPDLTVQVQVLQGDIVTHSDQVVALVDDAWSGLR